MKPSDNRTAHWLVTLSLIGAVLGWGYAWVGIRDTVRYYEPGPLALGRYLVASLVLLPFWLRRGARLPARADWPVAAIMGVLGFTAYNFCINLGEKTVAAGTASLIAACIPVMVTLGARYFYAEKLTWIGWGGIALAFAGVATTTLGAQEAFHLSLGALLVLAASVCAAIYGLLNKRLLQRYPPLEVTTWAIWAGTIGLLPFAGSLPKAVAHAPGVATMKVALLGIVPGAICYALFSYAISKVSMARVASWMFLVSLTSVVLGWLLLNELPTSMALTGGAITLAGVYLVNAKGHPPIDCTKTGNQP
jgi:drug/metabolite transporter (DMT)-like permease